MPFDTLMTVTTTTTTLVQYHEVTLEFSVFRSSQDVATLLSGVAVSEGGQTNYGGIASLIRMLASSLFFSLSLF